MSTSRSLAFSHLRQLARSIHPIPSSRLHTFPPNRSAWPIGSEDYDPHPSTPSSSSSQSPSRSTATTPSSSSIDTGTLSKAASSRTRAGPALQSEPTLDLKGKARATDPSSSSPSSASPRSSELPLPPRRKTIAYMESMKREAKPIVCLTAYDYPTGLSIRSADVDLCLVGDSLANVALGHSTTQSISLDVMIHHAQAVQRGLNSSMLVSQPHLPASPFLVVDMPFGSFMASESEAIRNAVKLIQETGADAVKIEGGEEILGLVRKLTQFGIPVMGHIGLQPQRVGSTSGYRVQGRSAVAAAEIYHQARELEKAGCFSIVLECIPWKLAEFITENLSITTIGIGAGNATDGQVLVVSDMIGELTSPAHILAGLSGEGEEASRSESSSSPPPPSPASHSPSPPKFVRSFTKPWSLGAMRISAIRDYVEAVRERRFPENDVEGYKIKPAEFQEFLEIVERKG